MLTEKNALLQRYNRNGACTIQNIISVQLCNALHDNFLRLMSAMETYYQKPSSVIVPIVNRWQGKAFDKPLMDTITAHTQEKLQILFKQSVRLIEIDFIYKSAIISEPTPCHQDAAYAANDPYSFSIWIPLMNVTQADSSLEYLPQSHLDNTQPLIDFWQLGFIDKIKQSKRWQTNKQCTSLAKGDAIVFHSNIWHGASRNTSGRTRLSLILRYALPNTVFSIPSANTSAFGMLNCASIIEQKLRELMHQSAVIPEKNYSLLLQQSFDLLNNMNTKSVFQLQVEHCLQSLIILNDASTRFYAGDNRGVVYKNLWSFLRGVNRLFS